MKNCKHIIWIACILAVLASCKKDELKVQNPLGLGGDSTAVTAIDKWIADSLTKPYNIDVRYRWDPSNSTIYKDVTPVDESRVIPLLSAIKKTWITPYNEVTGSDLFMKKYIPKQIILLGSVEYDATGSASLASEASGGLINILDVNQNYFKDPYISSLQTVRIIHHEFAHILHELVIYPQDFIGISSKLGLDNYTVTWYNLSDAYALQQGYASNYAMLLPREDFVETAAWMLTNGKGKWEEIKATANATARQALQQKEDIVVNYYKQTWNINFYDLQTKVQTGMNSLYKQPAVLDVFGYGITFSTASVVPSNTTLFPLPAAFTTIYNSAKTGLAAAVSGGSSGRVLDSFDVYQYSANSVLLECYYHATASPTTVQVASYLYSYTKDANNVFTFTLANRDANGTTFATALAPLVNYFSNNKFSLSWYADPSTTIYPRIKFTPQAVPGTYFIARLLQ